MVSVDWTKGSQHTSGCTLAHLSSGQAIGNLCGKLHEVPQRDPNLGNVLKLVELRVRMAAVVD